MARKQFWKVDTFKCGEGRETEAGGKRASVEMSGCERIPGRKGNFKEGKCCN